MDPKTGEVLALANWPAFNPQFLEDSRPETRRNRAVTDPYEPGSTIKPFIVAPPSSGARRAWARCGRCPAGRTARPCGASA
jgi:membrane peptidoglycan carboxypeptidase